jgi:periplasmic divalent cation tolerance protein
VENAHYLVLTTCPDEQTAQDMAYYLIENHLAACVNLLPQVRSIYRWQGALEYSAEVLLLIKTRRDVYPALEQAVRARHPYELPEIVALPLATGLAGYLAWIDQNLRENQEEITA